MTDELHYKCTLANLRDGYKDWWLERYHGGASQKSSEGSQVDGKALALTLTICLAPFLIAPFGEVLQLFAKPAVGGVTASLYNPSTILSFLSKLLVLIVLMCVLWIVLKRVFRSLREVAYGALAPYRFMKELCRRGFELNNGLRAPYQVNRG